jgi:hypothetical protein
VLYFDCDQTTEEDLVELKTTLLQYPGTRPLRFEFTLAGGRTIRLQPGNQYRITLLQELKEKLAAHMR